MDTIVNIAAYQFVALEGLPALRELFKRTAQQAKLKGTILLSPEGINLFMAGTREGIDGFLALVRSDERFAKLEHKESFSDTIPFAKLLVKVKAEIITLRMPHVQPIGGRAPSVDAATLKRWLDAGCDDAGKPIALLDTRNTFEVEHGTFEGAQNLNLKSFSAFGDAVQPYAATVQDKTVVSFCTGGIRCEKAALYMQELGMPNVLQLEGGILKYFETVGGAHYHGNCFVFDERIALDAQLKPATTLLSEKFY